MYFNIGVVWGCHLDHIDHMPGFGRHLCAAYCWLCWYHRCSSGGIVYNVPTANSKIRCQWRIQIFAAKSSWKFAPSWQWLLSSRYTGTTCGCLGVMSSHTYSLKLVAGIGWKTYIWCTNGFSWKLCWFSISTLIAAVGASKNDYLMSYCVIAYCLYCFTVYYNTVCHITSHHITSHHIISYHIIS